MFWIVQGHSTWCIYSNRAAQREPNGPPTSRATPGARDTATVYGTLCRALTRESMKAVSAPVSRTTNLHR